MHIDPHQRYTLRCNHTRFDPHYTAQWPCDRYDHHLQDSINYIVLTVLMQANAFEHTHQYLTISWECTLVILMRGITSNLYSQWFLSTSPCHTYITVSHIHPRVTSTSPCHTYISVSDLHLRVTPIDHCHIYLMYMSHIHHTYKYISHLPTWISFVTNTLVSSGGVIIITSSIRVAKIGSGTIHLFRFLLITSVTITSLGWNNSVIGHIIPTH